MGQRVETRSSLCLHNKTTHSYNISVKWLRKAEFKDTCSDTELDTNFVIKPNLRLKVKKNV